MGVIWKLGDKVFSGDRSRGEVVETDPELDLISIVWDGADDTGFNRIRYPANAPYLRKALPWE
jgi:hypothetical protein